MHKFVQINSCIYNNKIYAVTKRKVKSRSPSSQITKYSFLSPKCKVKIVDCFNVIKQ